MTAKGCKEKAVHDRDRGRLRWTVGIGLWL